MKTRFDRDVKTSLQRDNIRKAKETAPLLLEHVEDYGNTLKGLIDLLVLRNSAIEV